MATKKKKERLENNQPAASPTVIRPPGWLTDRRLLSGLIFAFSVLLYANTFSHDYAQDDAIVITDNMFTSRGVEGIPGILRYDTFYGFFKEEGKANLVAGGRYRPLSLVLFAVEVELFGQSPAISHVINALLYGLTAVVLYWLLLQFFRPAADRPAGYFIALAAALIFAAHPLHTEVVANIKGRDEILALLGSLGALSLSLLAFRRRQVGYAALAGVVFLLALFSKENAITFLAVTPLAYYFFTSAKPAAILRQTAPFVAAAALFLIVRGGILGWGISDPGNEMMNNPFIKVENGQYVPFTAGERLATITYTLGRYAELLVAPYPLTHDYYPRAVDIMNWGDWKVWLSLLLYGILGGYALYGMPRRDPVAFGILFFLVTISIVSNLFFPVGTNMAERLAFMPSVGYSLVLALLLYRFSENATSAGKRVSLRSLRPGLMLGGVIVLVYGALTVARNPAWKDNFTLFSSDIAVSPKSAKLQNALGGELITQSVDVTDEARRERMLRQAVQHLREALRIHPNYKNAYLLLGNAHYYLREWEEAIGYYRQALQLDENYQEALNNLGITYRDGGRFYGEQQGDVAKAIEYLEEAYRRRPDEYETARLLGVAYGISGDINGAIRLFTRATELEPDNADALYNLGTAYFQAGEPVRGQELHERAKRMDPKVEERMRNR